MSADNNKTREDSIGTEARILQEAEREFLEHGFTEARTTRIAERAGVTHAMLHYYYRTKQNLFDRIINTKFDTMSSAIAITIDNGERPIRERVAEAVRQHFEFVKKNPLLPRFMMTEVFGHPERFEAVSTKLQQTARTMIQKIDIELREASKRGECKYVDPLMLLFDIVSINIFPFLSVAAIQHILSERENIDRFLDHKKEENVELIIKRIEA